MRQAIVDEARKWIGTKFRHHGRDNRGVDCAGLIYVVYKQFIKLVDFIGYSQCPETGFVFRSIRSHATRIPPAEVQAADIVLLNFAGASTHFGIFTGSSVIHADTVLGCIVEHSIPVDGNGRVVAYFRMKGV